MIYIVGVMGYLGQSLMNYLSDRGHDVTGLMRESFLPIFRSEDTIINCAASGYRRRVYDIEQTVYDNWTTPLVLNTWNAGVANHIHFSSWTEECAPHHPYSRAKGLATDYLKDKAHICMLCSIWGGPYESPDKFMMGFLKACAKGEPYTLTHPFRQRDYVHVDTFCEEVEGLIFHKDYKMRYFATGRLRSFHEVFHTLRNITNREFPNVVMVNENLSTDYDWRALNPIFEDTFRDDLRKEWRNVCGS